MSIELEVDKYRELLTRRAAARKEEIDLTVEIQVAERRMELSLHLTTTTTTATILSEGQAFIQTHGAKLEPEDIEFLELSYRGTKEVCDHTSISATSLKRLANAGRIDFRKTDLGHFRYSTTSVVEYLIDAAAEDKE